MSGASPWEPLLAEVHLVVTLTDCVFAVSQHGKHLLSICLLLATCGERFSAL
jgi:hypothetical protein